MKRRLEISYSTQVLLAYEILKTLKKYFFMKKFLRKINTIVLEDQHEFIAQALQ